MSGNKAILDTNTIVLASKQQLDIEKLLVKYDYFYVSVITYMEVYGYDFANKKEKELIDTFFESIEIIETNKAIAEHVILYRKSKLKKIKLPDAIILATARHLDAELVTDDWDDFQNIDKNVKIVKIDSFRL
jgi:predicted nucleic acid-binding protein